MLVLVLVMPWRGSINAPALLDASYTTLYAPSAGRLATLDTVVGQRVEPGQILMTLDAPQLEHDLRQAERHYEELSWRRASMGFDAAMRQQSLVVTAELLTQNQKLRGLMEKKEQLSITAPAAGLIVNLQPELRPGNWIANAENLLAIRGEDALNLKAYISEQQIGRLQPGMAVVFYPEDPAWGLRKGQVAEIDQVSVRELENLYMASLFGGDIAVREGDGQQLLTQESLYVVNITVDDDSEIPNQVLRGRVVISADAESLLNSLFRKVTALFQKESGF